MDNIVLLSEIHPLGSLLVSQKLGVRAGLSYSPGTQAFIWHHLPVTTVADRSMQAIVEVSPEQVLEQIVEIYILVADRGQKLVIRDWSHLDFIGFPFRSPSFSDSLSQLLTAEFDLHHAYLIRHPLDQWLSLSALEVFSSITPQEFLEGYLCYLSACQEQTDSLFKYETFLVDTNQFLLHLSRALEVEFDPGWQQKWQDYQCITGDDGAIQARIDRISTTSRRASLDPETQALFEGSDIYLRVLELTGYGSSSALGGKLQSPS